MNEVARIAESLMWQIVGGDEAHPRLFRMRDARQYLADVADDHAEVAGCVLSVRPKGEKYEVVQLMTDPSGRLIMNGKDHYLGRRFTASEIDDSVRKFLKGETRRSMTLAFDET